MGALHVLYMLRGCWRGNSDPSVLHSNIVIIEYNQLFDGEVELPSWYKEYADTKMISVESDMESGSELNDSGAVNDHDSSFRDELFVEEEVADELLDNSTARVLRHLGDGLDDTTALRSELKHNIDTDLV